jgi:hypothetical protein
MSIHYRSECVHGIIVGQCRCPDKNKSVVIVECPSTCLRKDEPVGKHRKTA